MSLTTTSHHPKSLHSMTAVARPGVAPTFVKQPSSNVLVTHRYVEENTEYITVQKQQITLIVLTWCHPNRWMWKNLWRILCSLENLVETVPQKMVLMTYRRQCIKTINKTATAGIYSHTILKSRHVVTCREVIWIFSISLGNWIYQ